MFYPMEILQKNVSLRRQWVILPKNTNGPSGWRIIELSGLHDLHSHPELRITIRSDENSKIVLLGLAIDARFPESDAASTLEAIRHDTLVSWIKHVTGWYAVIFVDAQTLAIYNDPCGLMGVYYSRGAAASTVCLIPGVSRENVSNAAFPLSWANGFYAGSLCPYPEVKALMANHCLNLNTGNCKRFWPTTSVPGIKFTDAVKQIAFELKSTVCGLRRHGRIAMSLTGGRDSRIVLAAAREWADKMDFFTIRRSARDEPDVEIAKRLARQFGLRHRVFESCGTPKILANAHDEILAGLCYTENQDLLGTLHRNLKSDFIHVSGLLAEGLRAELWPSREPSNPSLRTLIDRLFTRKNPAIFAAMDEWRCSLPNDISPREVFDLLFWEQVGNRWIGPSVNSCSVCHESFPHFNNRQIIRTAMGIPSKAAYEGELPFALIQEMWPELMAVPFVQKRRPFGKSLPKWMKHLARSFVPR